MYLSLLLMEDGSLKTWDTDMAKLTGYDTQSLAELLILIHKHSLHILKKSKLTAIKTKHSSKQFHEATAIALPIIPANLSTISNKSYASKY